MPAGLGHGGARGVAATATATTSQQLWASGGALVQRAQERNIPFRESLTWINADRLTTKVFRIFRDSDSNFVFEHASAVHAVVARSAVGNVKDTLVLS